MISASISGTAEVAQRLDGIGMQVREELRGGLERIAAMLQRDIVEGRLAGQVLATGSGRLRQSIVASAVIGEGDSLSVGVSSGAPGVETVRAHVRRIRQAFGRPIAQKMIDVRAHSRTVDVPERSFLRTALRDLEASGAIRAEIDTAIGRATA